MVASTLTVDPMEDVAPLLGETPGLFQLYTPADRELARASSTAPRPPASRGSS